MTYPHHKTVMNHECHLPTTLANSCIMSSLLLLFGILPTKRRLFGMEGFTFSFLPGRIWWPSSCNHKQKHYMHVQQNAFKKYFVQWSKQLTANKKCLSNLWGMEVYHVNMPFKGLCYLLTCVHWNRIKIGFICNTAYCNAQITAAIYTQLKCWL